LVEPFKYATSEEFVAEQAEHAAWLVRDAEQWAIERDNDQIERNMNYIEHESVEHDELIIGEKNRSVESRSCFLCNRLVDHEWTLHEVGVTIEIRRPSDDAALSSSLQISVGAVPRVDDCPSPSWAMTTRSPTQVVQTIVPRDTDSCHECMKTIQSLVRIHFYGLQSAGSPFFEKHRLNRSIEVFRVPELTNLIASFNSLDVPIRMDDVSGLVAMERDSLREHHDVELKQWYQGNRDGRRECRASRGVTAEVIEKAYLRIAKRSAGAAAKLMRSARKRFRDQKIIADEEDAAAIAELAADEEQIADIADIADITSRPRRGKAKRRKQGE